MNKTGIFYQLESDQTLATRQISGHKKNKEWLSVALCANANGLHKLNSLIIDKLAKLQCFKNVRL